MKKNTALLAVLLITLTACNTAPSGTQAPSETDPPTETQAPIVIQDSVMQIGEVGYISENMEFRSYDIKFTKIIFPTGNKVRSTKIWTSAEDTMSCALYGSVKNTSETETIDLSKLSCSFSDENGTAYDSFLYSVDYETGQMSDEEYNIIQPGEIGEILCAAEFPKELLLTKNSFTYILTDGNVKHSFPMEWEGWAEVEIGSIISGSQSDVEILAADWIENVAPSNRGMVSTVLKGESGRLFIHVLAKVTNRTGETAGNLHDTVKFRFATGFSSKTLDYIYETDDGSKFLFGGNGQVGNSVLSDDMKGTFELADGESALIDYYLLLPEAIADRYSNLEVEIDETVYCLELPPIEK